MSTHDSDPNISYYEELADQYDLFFQDLAQNMQVEGDWLDSILRPRHVRTVLDASCGTGRQAIPLAVRGYQVVAADPSRAMLKRASREAEAHDVTVPLVRTEFADLTRHIGREFDAVLALGNGLCNQKSLDSISLSLRALRKCCRPGGIGIIGIKDFAAIRASRQRFHGHRVADSNGRRTILFELWDIVPPHLLSTAFVLSGHSPGGRAALAWDVRSARTCEFMLNENELRQVALEAGFHRADRIPHPTELAFLLYA